MEINRKLKGFQRRIEIERGVLTMINSKFPGHKPLYGLTLNAINSWKEDFLLDHGTKGMSIVEALNNISSFAQLEADCSREIFTEVQSLPKTSLDNLTRQLEKAILECQ